MFNQLISRYQRHTKLLAPVCLGMFVTGCGGAGQSGTLASPSQSSHVGAAVVSYSGQPHPMITGSTGQITAFGQAGASYSSLTIDPTPNLASTTLAFTRNVGGVGQQLYTMPATGGTPQQIVHTTISGYASYSSSGLMALITQANGQYLIETMLGDGSQQHTVLTNVPGVPTISPNGSTIAYLTATNGNLYSVPVAGGTPKEIYSGGNAGQGPVIWSPDGTKIAFTALNAATNYFCVYTMPAAGGTPTNITPSNYNGQGSAIATSWSPDGNSIACTFIPRVGTTDGCLIISVDGGGYSWLTPANYSDSYPCFSPDNNKIAFYCTNAGGATPGIYECDFAGTNPQLVLADPPATGATGPLGSLVWSPFPSSEKFVGTGGTLATAASGLLMSQNGGQFASLLTFAATTPSKATVSLTNPNSSGGAMIYSLGADAITNISYTNIYNGGHTSLTLATTPSAVVSVDGSTGLVDFVAPTTFRKAESTPAFRNGSSSITGPFSAIYDANGVNLAPTGATTIEVDQKTGKLISFR